MPHLMNCEHSDEGWCLACVKAQWQEMTHYRELLEQISKDDRKTRARRLAESGLMFWDTQQQSKASAPRSNVVREPSRTHDTQQPET